MAENVLEQVLNDLQQSVGKFYPEHGDLRNLRVVGHTPKNDHFIYDVNAEFANGSERIAVKAYRASKAEEMRGR